MSIYPALGAGADVEPLFEGDARMRAWSAAQYASLLVFSIAVPFQLVVVTLYWLLLATPYTNPVRAWGEETAAIGGWRKGVRSQP